MVAFSTANRIPHDPPLKPRQIEELPNEAVSPLFLAGVEAVEEAVYNWLTAAVTVTGRDGHTVEALPIDRLREILPEAR